MTPTDAGWDWQLENWLITTPERTLHHDGFRIAGRVILLVAFGLSWNYLPRRFFQGYN